MIGAVYRFAANQLTWRFADGGPNTIVTLQASNDGVTYVNNLAFNYIDPTTITVEYAIDPLVGEFWRVLDPTAGYPEPLLVPVSGIILAPQRTITSIARIAGGVAEIVFSGAVTVIPGGFAGAAGLDINGHSSLTFNAQPAANTVRVNTGGGTTVGTPWTLSTQLEWIAEVLGGGAGLII